MCFELISNYTDILAFSTCINTTASFMRIFHHSRLLTERVCVCVYELSYTRLTLHWLSPLTWSTQDIRPIKRTIYNLTMDDKRNQPSRPQRYDSQTLPSTYKREIYNSQDKHYIPKLQDKLSNIIKFSTNY